MDGWMDGWMERGRSVVSIAQQASISAFHFLGGRESWMEGGILDRLVVEDGFQSRVLRGERRWMRMTVSPSTLTANPPRFPSAVPLAGRCPQTFYFGVQNLRPKIRKGSDVRHITFSH
jgi:hypothetical protein